MKSFCRFTQVFIRILPALFLAVGLSPSATVHAAEVGKTFSTPEEAVTALADSVQPGNRDALRALLGLATDELVAADQVLASNELAAFSFALQTTHRIVRESDAKCVLVTGANSWPFPIPLVKQPDGQWFFDTDAGKEELLNRRIGRNELETLRVARTYVEAQREYAVRDRDGDEVLEYAQRISSTPGAKDGLYWPLELDGEISPLGPLFAQAQSLGYDIKSKEQTTKPQPFHGYYFKILTSQGKHAPGGKYDYIINGNMIGGFALVAWPADYGESGIMTFMVNQQGRVYQKDLGPKTGILAPAIKAYDRDRTWTLSPD